MSNFDEAWLRDHERKMRSQTVATEPPRFVQFTLAKPVKLLNETLRMHWSARRRYAKALSAEIAKAQPGILYPMQRASVEVVRYSVQEPDFDGLVGGCKGLIDCLLVRSDRHPHGLGFIVDDSPEHLEFTARHERAATRKEQGTTVTIRRIDG